MRISLHSRTTKGFALATFLATGLFFATHETLAATRTWNGGGANVNWNTAANWGGTAPISWDDLVFAGTTSLAPNNNFAANTIFNSISFDASAGAFVTSGNAISLATGISSSATGNETFGNGVTLMIGGHAIANTGAGVLSLSGVFTRNAGATADFTNTGGGSIVLTTSNSLTNGILTSAASPNGVAYATFNGTDWATVGGGNSVAAYSAYQTSSNPAIWGAADNVSLAGNPAASLNDTAINSLRFSDSSAVTLNSGKTLTLGTGGLLVTGTGTDSISGGTLKGSGGTSKELVVIQNNITNAFTIGSVIADNGGATSLTKAGAGTLNLNGNNTYTGATSINNGTVVVGPGAKLGAGALNLGGSANAASLDLTAASSTVASLTVNSNTQPSPGTANAITIGAGQTLTVSGNVLVGGVNQGTTTNTAFNPITLLTVSGAGTLATGSGTGGTFVVGNLKGGTNTGGGDTIIGKLDLSGLANFTANYGPTGVFSVGASASGAGDLSPFGQLVLASNNTITAGALSVGLNGPGAGNTSKSSLLLGQTTVLNVDAVTVGAGKTQPTTFDPNNPNPTGLIKFNTGLTNPCITLRGSAGGTSRVGTVTIVNGDLYTASSGTNESGVIDFTGGVVDAKIDTLIAGTGANNGNSAASFGILTFDNGTVDVNTVKLGLEDRVPAVSNAAATGTINVNGTGNLILGAGGMELGHKLSTVTAAMTGNLNVNGGTVTASGDIFGGGGTSNVTLNSGTMNMGGKGIGTAAGPITTIMLNGGTVSNVGGLAGKSITINAGVVFSGTPAIAVTDGGSLTNNLGTPLTVSGVSGGGVAPGTATIVGDVIVAPGSQIAPGSNTVAGTLLFSNNLTINGGSGTTAKFKLADAPGSGDLVTVGQNLTLNGITNIQIGILGNGPQINSTYTLFTYSGTLTGNETNFNVLGPGSRTTFTIVPTGTTPGQINLTVGGTAPFALTWKGDVNSTWDLNNTANWRDGSNTAQKFFNLDTVTFDDTSTNLNDVQITGTVSPGSITVNANRNYKFAGTGNIASGSLVKSGNGTLVIANNNTYGGTTDINGGVLQIGDGGTTGSLGSGAVNLNAGTLSFNRSDAITVAASINGAGGLNQDGTGTLTLSGASSFSGGVNVNAGVVRITNATGAGSGGPVTINPNGTVAVTATMSNPIILNGGTLGAVNFGTGNGANANVTTGDFTAQPGTTSTIRLGDPQNTSAASDVKFGGASALHGTGNINVVSEQTAPDSGGGLRLQGTGASDFSGTITVNNRVKFELQTGQAGPFSPMGTGKVVMVAGTYEAATTNGNYSEFQVRNTIGGTTTVGNDIEVTGTGLADLNFPAAIANNVVVLGNLKVGAGQVLGVNKNNGTYQFSNVTLNGTPTLSPNTPNFGA